MLEKLVSRCLGWRVLLGLALAATVAIITVGRPSLAAAASASTDNYSPAAPEPGTDVLLGDPGGIRKRLAEMGLDVPDAEQRTPEALAAFQKAEIEKWWPIIKAAGIKAE